MDDAFLEGIRLFNSKKYFECHEALEAVWLISEGDEKIFLHGLIQIAAAFHHHGRGNPQGFRSLLEKGINKLEKFGATKKGINLRHLREQLRPWREFVNAADTHPAQAPPLPRIKASRLP